MNSTYFLFSWLPAVVWCGLIFYFSSIPGLNSGFGVWDFYLRKGAHMFEYGVLTLLFIRAIRRTWTSLAPLGVMLLAFLLSLAYAISDEFHQAFVPMRGPSAMDVLVDTVGIVFALIVAYGFGSKAGRERVMATARKLVFFLALIPLAGCGAEAEFKRARGAEIAGRSYEAWEKFQSFAARHPESDRSAEALFRAGWLAQNVLRDCAVARAFYTRVEGASPDASKWAAAAAFQAANCPDYFPLVPGATWVEGDSESGGKNARIESVCEVSTGTVNIPFSSGVIVRDYFGGNAKFKTTRSLYRKEGATVWEHSADGSARPLLSGPFEKGAHWEATFGGRTFKYEVASTSETVTVRGGTFFACLVIRSRADGVPGATNEFYAPFVGKILTSFQTDGGERRNTELLSFKAGERLVSYP